MIHIELEDKINGAEIISLEGLILGFLEDFQENASEENFVSASHWDVIKFFARYLDEHDYCISKSPHVRSQKFSELSKDIQDRCKHFYSLNQWVYKTKGSFVYQPTRIMKN